MTPFHIVFSAVSFATLVFIASPSAQADEPIAFRDTDFTVEEWQAIESLLMRKKPGDDDVIQVVDIEFVQFIMGEEGLSQAEALQQIRRHNVAVAFSDLTGDGNRELLVLFTADDLPGNGAAPTAIMEQTAEGWRPLTEVHAYAVGIYGDPPPPYPLCVSDERLNGRPYLYSADQIAYWDGSQYLWECVTRCEGSEPGDNPFGEKIAEDMRCIDGQ